MKMTRLKSHLLGFGVSVYWNPTYRFAFITITIRPHQIILHTGQRSQPWPLIPGT
jgi:hypothetical protein